MTNVRIIIKKRTMYGITYGVLNKALNRDFSIWVIEPSFVVSPATKTNGSVIKRAVTIKWKSKMKIKDFMNLLWSYDPRLIGLWNALIISILSLSSSKSKVMSNMSVIKGNTQFKHKVIKSTANIKAYLSSIGKTSFR